jgi:hypothetical protein
MPHLHGSLGSIAVYEDLLNDHQVGLGFGHDSSQALVDVCETFAERLSLRHANNACLDDASGLAAGVGVDTSEACVSKTGINAEDTHAWKPICLA